MMVDATPKAMVESSLFNDVVDTVNGQTVMKALSLQDSNINV